MAADNNSFSRSDEKKPGFEERKKDMVQFTGVKQAAKKPENPVWQWFKDMFFSGRTMKEIVKDAAENYIAPQFKDTMRNTAVAMLDMAIYKDHKPGGTSGTPGSFITNYVQYGARQTQTATALEASRKKEEETIKSGFESPAFARKVDAEQFLASMKNYVTKYQTMSVQDLAWMQGKTIDYTWDKYGWEARDILAISGPKHISNPQAPWMIDMPKATVLS